MTYTVWLDDVQIGETSFELENQRRKHCGSFHPTEYGLAVLPSITAMAPALFAFGRMCRREGLDPDDPNMTADKVRAIFDETPEGRRIISAAKQLDRVVVRDPAGRLMPWESLAITDLETLLAAGREERQPEDDDDEPAPQSDHDPIRFMISLTERAAARAPAPPVPVTC